MMWLALLIAGFVFYESVVINLFRLMQQSSPEKATWVALGSKVVKLLLTVAVILLVPRLTTIPLRTFALTTAGIYAISLVVESIIFLKKK